MTTVTRSIPAARSSCSSVTITGRPSIGSTGFAYRSVSGRSRRPSPAPSRRLPPGLVSIVVVVWIVVAAVVVLLLLFLVLTYNRLVRLRNETETGWANIDVQLKRRSDLVPNLVEAVKGYAAHESRDVRGDDAGARAQPPSRLAGRGRRGRGDEHPAAR